MISGKIKTFFDEEVKYFTQSTAFFVLADRGELKKSGLEYFLNNTAYAITYTPRCLSLAKENAKTPELKEFFSKKDLEEKGHVEWAYDDLQQGLNKDRKVNFDKVDLNVKCLFDYLIDLINQDTRFYILYMCLSEYTLTLYGPKLAFDLENKCGFLPEAFSVISKHIDLDVDHAEKALEILDTLFTHDEWRSCERVMRSILTYINGFYNSFSSAKAIFE